MALPTLHKNHSIELPPSIGPFFRGDLFSWDGYDPLAFVTLFRDGYDGCDWDAPPCIDEKTSN